MAGKRSSPRVERWITARVTRLGLARQTRHDARAVAAELYVTCDEFWPPGKPAIAVYDVQQIAEHTLDIPIWSMWWD
jgi:hypothetical protein